MGLGQMLTLGMFGNKTDLERWRREDGGVAWALSLGPDELARPDAEILVLPGQVGLLDMEGSPEGELPPGIHTLEKVAGLLSSKTPRTARVTFLHDGDIPVYFEASELEAADRSRLGVSGRIAVRIHEPRRFVEAFLTGRRADVTVADVGRELEDALRRALAEYVGGRPRDELPGPGALVMDLEVPLERGLRQALERLGLRWIRLVDLRTDEGDWLEVVEGRAEMAKRRALEEVRGEERSLVERAFSEETRHELALVQTEAEKDRVLRELDKEGLLADADRKALLRSIESAGAKDAEVRDQELRELQEDFRERMTRKRFDRELEEERRRFEAGLSRERARSGQLLEQERARLELDFERKGREVEVRRQEEHLQVEKLRLMEDIERARKDGEQKRVLELTERFSGDPRAILLVAKDDPDLQRALVESGQMTEIARSQDPAIAALLASMKGDAASAAAQAMFQSEGEKRALEGKLAGHEETAAQARESRSEMAEITREAVRGTSGSACEHSVPPGGKFCSHCGARVT